MDKLALKYLAPKNINRREEFRGAKRMPLHSLACRGLIQGTVVKGQHLTNGIRTRPNGAEQQSWALSVFFKLI